MIPARWQVTRATYRLPRNSTVLLCGRLEHVLICRRRRRSSAAGGHREQGLGLAGLHNPAGGLGGTTGRQGPPSAGRSPSPGVTHSKRSSSHILPFDSLTVFQCHALWRRAVQLCVFGIIANHIKLPSLTQYSIKLSILIFMAFALIPRLFWLELMAHLFAS